MQLRCFGEQLGTRAHNVLPSEGGDSAVNSQNYRRRVGWAAFVLGALLGALFAPGIQNASLIMGFFGGVIAQTAAFCASSGQMRGLVLALLATLIGCGLILVVTRQNEPEIVSACAKLIFICGAMGTSIGFGIARWFASKAT